MTINIIKIKQSEGGWGGKKENKVICYLKQYLTPYLFLLQILLLVSRISQEKSCTYVLASYRSRDAVTEHFQLS